ncbi:MAG: IS21 family transposase [Hyphomonadaceae bacterium]
MDGERIIGSPLWSDPRGQEMKTPDDVAEMLRLKACGWGIKRIGRALGCSHHTVRHYVLVGGVAPFKAPKRRKLLDGHEGWLRERFIRHRGNADVVRQDLLAEKGLVVSRRTLQRAVQSHRQALRAEALATTRFETPPGRQLQIDFGERFVEIGGDRIKAFVFVATLGHSRRVHVRAFRQERQEHWFAGLESTFMTFGGVPEEVLMDNPRALVVRHDAVSRTVQFNDKLIAFARHWGFAPRACAPYRARTKGKTENGVGYVKKNAIAGHGFESWEAFEAHLGKWEREVANVRVHGTTGESPIARFERDEAHRLKPLSGRPPFGLLRELSRIVGNDCAVEIDTNSYSAPWRLIGERVAVTVSAGEVRIRHGAREVAVHKLVEGRRRRVIDAAHLEGVAGRGGAVFRRASEAAPALYQTAPPALLRPLAEYEAAIGGSF